ncbi:PaaI family thioesterase [Aeromicrobium sp. CF3.5]|uniref:PaaI family thioesterase n=1 Tax=Aeromicrobium sp. CF3.5 TaxID=3373078 RepID=UPI003EE74459
MPPFSRDQTPEQLRQGINSWPTFATQEIEVLEIADDWSRAVIRLDLTEDNSNYFGTAFGGSLFSMIDPFVVILLANQMGEDFTVWDKVVEIDFVRPGAGPVTAIVEMPANVVEEVRAATAHGEKLLRWFEVPLLAEDGSVVAVQRRQIYVRKRRDA